MLSRVNKLGKRADSFAHGVREHGEFVVLHYMFIIKIFKCSDTGSQENKKLGWQNDVLWFTYMLQSKVRVVMEVW